MRCEGNSFLASRLPPTQIRPNPLRADELRPASSIYSSRYIPCATAINLLRAAIIPFPNVSSTILLFQEVKMEGRIVSTVATTDSIADSMGPRRGYSSSVELGATVEVVPARSRSKIFG